MCEIIGQIKQAKGGCEHLHNYSEYDNENINIDNFNTSSIFDTTDASSSRKINGLVMK